MLRARGIKSGSEVTLSTGNAAGRYTVAAAATKERALMFCCAGRELAANEQRQFGARHERVAVRRRQSAWSEAMGAFSELLAGFLIFFPALNATK